MHIKSAGYQEVVMATGDWHRGIGSSHEEGIAKFIERAESLPWIHLGDAIESILPGDKRFSIDEHHMSFTQALKTTSELISSAKKTCLGLVCGNHEETVGKQIGSATQLLADFAGVPFLGHVCWMQFGRNLAFFRHKGMPVHFGGAGSLESIEANAVNSLRRSFEPFQADVCGQGHQHRALVAVPKHGTRITAVGSKSQIIDHVPEQRWCFMVPAMFKVYDETQEHDNYAAQCGYKPTALGWMEIVFNKKGRGVDAILQFDEHGTMVWEHKEDHRVM